MIKKKITAVILSILVVTGLNISAVTAAENADAVPADVMINEDKPEVKDTEKSEPAEENPAVSEQPSEKPAEIPVIVTEIVYRDNPEQISDGLKYDMPETEYIPVQDIVVSEFKDTMFIDETQNMSATVFPATATDSQVSYSSSDRSVAKVDRLGKVTAVGSGSCIISASCGGRYTSFNLTVKVKTEAVSVSSKYIVLKPAQKYELNAKAVPDNAPQSLKYKSQNADVVTVDDKGVLTAVKNGNTSVIITNDDYTMSVNVIVNTDGKADSDEAVKNDAGNQDYGVSDSVAEKIRNSSEETVTVSGVKTITSETLRALYGTDITLVIECDEYDIRIFGRDIVNADHDFSTELDFTENEKGILLNQNKENRLPGKISIKLKDSSAEYRYIYLRGTDGDDLRKLNSVSGKNMFSISSAGEYLISESKAERFRINFIWVIGAAGVILAMTVIYIFTKRKYWFW
ncbi:MAG: Ig-like domain-containing protein [Oscillospiraceae bacterium]|nr:Ig-like domain-containing protein [Oscillospiraceae bacterium]